MENTAKDEDESPKEDKKNKEKRKHVYPYGNFKNYYAHRNGELDEDPRLEVFRKEWFEGKDCLDIGCNSGKLTIRIAQKFCCRSILGIDIDSDRVQDAYLNLNRTVRSKSAKKKTPVEASKLKDKDHAENLEDGVGASSNEEKPVELSSLEGRNLSDIVSFKQENFVQSQYPLEEEQYDTILCLSVTQWIHLNWGDDGLFTVFHKIWRLLQPGGILVLEPQLWKSYENKHEFTETTIMNYQNIKFPPDMLPEILLDQTTIKNYQNIKFRPETFPEILLDRIGFRTVELINSAWSNRETRFNRPILVFKK